MNNKLIAINDKIEAMFVVSFCSTFLYNCLVGPTWLVDGIVVDDWMIPLLDVGLSIEFAFLSCGIGLAAFAAYNFVQIARHSVQDKRIVRGLKIIAVLTPLVVLIRSIDAHYFINGVEVNGFAVSAAIFFELLLVFFLIERLVCRDNPWSSASTES